MVNNSMHMRIGKLVTLEKFCVDMQKFSKIFCYQNKSKKI